MQISTNHTVNQNTQNKNPLAFKAKLTVISGNLDFSPLESTFRRLTKKIKGDVILQDKGDFFEFSYCDLNENVFQKNTRISLDDMKANTAENEKEPFMGVIKMILANGGDLLTGAGHKENAFTKVFNDLMFKSKKPVKVSAPIEPPKKSSLLSPDGKHYGFIRFNFLNR